MFVPDLAAPELEPEDAHHLANVLRLAKGDLVIASDGRGAFRPCRLEFGAPPERGSSRASRSRLARLALAGPVVTIPPPDPPLMVGFALHKGERPEWAVQKLTELGIDRIITFTTARTVVRLDDTMAGRRGDRLRRVAREAAAQCRRVILPEVDDPVPYEMVLASFPGVLAVAEPGAPPLAASTTGVLVGPEGGFTEEELGRAPTLVGLTDTVLRAETAAVAAGVLLVSIRTGRVRPR